MAQPYGLILILLIAPATSVRLQDGVATGAKQARKVPLTRTVKLPVIQLSSPNANEKQGNPAALEVWPGAEDELPEGPSGFDVFADGSFVIADPLSLRLVVYDAQGNFKRALPVGFAADSVTVTNEGMILAREANTDAVHPLDREGKPLEQAPKLSPMPEATLVRGENKGSISVGASPGLPAGTLAVRFDEKGSTMVSLQAIGTDSGLGIFVALEATVPEGGTDGIDVRKMVQRYSPQGVLVAESAWIPLDYFVPPVDELRVRKGIVYQLMTTRTEVRVNEWDMNER
jgi:hypothetical protein